MSIDTQYLHNYRLVCFCLFKGGYLSLPELPLEERSAYALFSPSPESLRGLLTSWWSWREKNNPALNLKSLNSFSEYEFDSEERLLRIYFGITEAYVCSESRNSGDDVGVFVGGGADA